MLYRLILVFAMFFLSPFVYAASGVFSPHIAFSDKAQKFLSVYSVQDSVNDGIYGMFIDRRGERSSPFVIYNSGSVINVIDVRIAYLSSSDQYLVVFSSYDNSEYKYKLIGQLIDYEGNKIGKPFTISENLYGIDRFEVLDDVSSKEFLVVWLDYRTRGTLSLYGIFIKPNGTLSDNEIQILNLDSLISFDIEKDSNNNRYFIAYSTLNNREINIMAGFLKENLLPDVINNVGNSTDYNCQVSVAFNNDKLFFIAYTDEVGTSGSYYTIKGLLIDDDNGEVTELPLMADEPSLNTSPDLIYNNYNKYFSIAYQSEYPNQSASNILVKNIDFNGEILEKFVVYGSKTRFLFAPSIAENSICGNEVVVYIDSNRELMQDDCGSTLIGGLCRFYLNVSKSGDGSGKVTSYPKGIDCGQVCQFEYQDQETVTLEAIPDESSLFIRYKASDCTDNPICNLSIDSDKSVEAIFNLKTFAITTNSSQGGRIEPANPIVKYGQSQTFNILPEANYLIEDVEVDDVSVGAVSTYTFTNVTQEHKIYAKFKPYSSDAGTIEDIITEDVFIFEDVLSDTSSDIYNKEIGSPATVVVDRSSSGCSCALLE